MIFGMNMSSMRKNKGLILNAPVAALMMATLSACGGGGGGSAVQPGASSGISSGLATVAGALKTLNNVMAQVIPPVVSVPAPTYPAGSEELSAFKLLNAERSRCGFGLVAQNAQIDAAAKAHNDYQIRNNLDSHKEDGARFPAGFTGATVKERLASQGYVNAGQAADEYNFYFGVTPKVGKGERSIRLLLGAPYHLRGMMSGYRDVGMSLRTNADLGKPEPVIFFGLNMAYKQDVGSQSLATGDVLTYPCEGAKGVNRALMDEEPNPVPGRNLTKNPLGTPIYVSVRESQKLVITKASITNLSTTKGVALRTPVTGANDPHGPCLAGCYKSHEGYIIPDAPLLANTEYLVTVEGINSGVLFSRTFRFATGN